MIKLIQHCRCNVCNAEITFDRSDYDLKNLPEITCTRCGMPTKLYATTPPDRQLDEESQKKAAEALAEAFKPRNYPPLYDRPTQGPNMAQAWGWTWRVIMCLFLVSLIVSLVFGLFSCASQF